MTFNVRGSFHDDGENAWERRAALNVRTIARHDPDLVGLQEVQAGNLEAYGRDLPPYERVVGPEYGAGEPWDRLAIFWKPERLELLESGGLWLSRTPDRRSLDWDAACIRTALWARFRVAETGAEIVHLNTHLDHRGELAREEGARLIVAELRRTEAEGYPAVVTGDFNCGPGTTPYALFAEAGFSDSYLAAGRDPRERPNTFHRFQGNSFIPWEGADPVYLDWILTRDGASRIDVTSSSVVRDHEHPVYPSDHYPVLADLLLD